MYADREEALRRSLANDGPPSAEERERQLQEELRRRAAGSRREPRDYDSYDTRRASRRRGDDVHYQDDGRYSTRSPRDDNMDGHWRSDGAAGPPPPRQRGRGGGGGRGRYDYADSGNARARRRSRSPPTGGRGLRSSFPPVGAEYEARSVFCSELDSRVGQRDLGEMFEESLGPGTVVDVQLDVDPRTRTTRGIGYVELAHAADVPRAIELSGKRMFGCPILVQSADAARKNCIVNMYEPPRQVASLPPPQPTSTSLPVSTSEQASTSAYAPPPPAPQHNNDTRDPSISSTGARLHVSNLHFDIAAPHVRAVFEPFGQVDDVEVCFNHATGKSKGFGFVQFRHAHEARQAMDQLDGFELAGRSMRVGPVNPRGHGGDRSRYAHGDAAHLPLPSSSTDRRFALMEKLARSDPERPPPPPERAGANTAPPSRAILLRHMFDPAEETEPNWHIDLQEDVRLECARHGHVETVLLDKTSRDGEVYVCFSHADEAHRACTSLQGRFFGGKLVEASLYVQQA